MTICGRPPFFLGGGLDLLFAAGEALDFPLVLTSSAGSAEPRESSGSPELKGPSKAEDPIAESEESSEEEVLEMVMGS